MKRESERLWRECEKLQVAGNEQGEGGDELVEFFLNWLAEHYILGPMCLMVVGGGLSIIILLAYRSAETSAPGRDVARLDRDQISEAVGNELAKRTRLATQQHVPKFVPIASCRLKLSEIFAL
jgi:hypothetical protein